MSPWSRRCSEDEGANRLCGEVGKEEAGVPFVVEDGCGSGGTHVAGGVEGLDVEGGVVGVVRVG